jgi:Tol biopolymer transport system component
MVEASGLRLDAFDLERQTLARLTREAAGTTWPTWNRDGTAVFFRRNSAPYWVATDGTGKEGRVPGGGANDYLSSAGPDPDSFLCVRITPTASGDLTLISRTGAFEPKALIATPAYEGGGQLSPDGRWLVYVSNESGQFEVQVRRYPQLERKWVASAGFGGQPRWRADGREISYRDGQNMLAVSFDGSKEEPAIGKPEVLFKDEYDFGLGLTTANYDVTKDGRFIMLRRDTRGISMSLVLNWAEELKEIMARGGTR